MTTREATPLATSPQETPAPRRTTTTQRHPVDLVRVVLGLAIFGLGFLIAQRGELPVLEGDLFRIVNNLPEIVFPVVWAVMQLGNVVAVPVVAGVAALTRRFRMARDMLVSGLLAYFAADFVKSVVGRERPAGLVDANLLDGNVSGIGFISGHAAVAAALATAAVPYLTRRGRRAAWALAWTVALARVYVGAHLPLDIIGGAAVGWAIGSLVHYVLGVPRWEPELARVAALLHRFGLPVRDLRPADVIARSSHPFVALDDDGRQLYVKALDPDRFERDWVYRLYRFIAVRDVKDADAVAPLGQQAEHEAVAAMTARERGVRVPAVVLARGTDRGGVVVQQHVNGRPLDDLPSQEVTPALLAEVWHQVARLRAARIAHHDLVASSVLVDRAGEPWIVDFGNAQTGADAQSLDGDTAELMASLALHVDAELVVASALDGLGADAVSAALPGLAPLTLSSATRNGMRARPGRLRALRREIRRRLQLPDPGRPEFGPPGLTARLAVAAGVALVLIGVPLLAGATDVVESVEVGGWRWLGGAFALAVLARAAMAAAALLTVQRRLALGRTFGATLAADGATLLHGRTGWRRSAARFLERAGVVPGEARRATDRFVAGAIVAAVLVALGTLVLAVVEGRLTGWRTPEALVPAVLLGLAAWGLVLVGQELARRHGAAAVPVGDAEPPGQVTRTLREALTGRGAATAGRNFWPQLGWASLGVALEAAALAAALHAVGGNVPLLATMTVYGALHMLWSVLPVTGMPGAADVALLLALLALGAPLASACAGVLAFRLLTFWIPAGLGSLLSARFEHRHLT
ncbi:undecaprenyl-diphosphatase [Blastococcus aggregatus]|uniref:non-specific serine/threonine protein kinase n=1 Tax=Blastococcus aggregatus TaxID=38502 RepID=A0A285V7N2_9ACTN|nr:phosphatase PAP2 family protein [Blastococcus aggregatus]SOC49588.1 undecaprenyl-diphosphatase [Blastococcus aggregatus]